MLERTYPLARKALFRLEAERAHNWSLRALRGQGGPSVPGPGCPVPAEAGSLPRCSPRLQPAGWQVRVPSSRQGRPPGGANHPKLQQGRRGDMPSAPGLGRAREGQRGRDGFTVELLIVKDVEIVGLYFAMP